MGCRRAAGAVALGTIIAYLDVNSPADRIGRVYTPTPSIDVKSRLNGLFQAMPGERRISQLADTLILLRSLEHAGTVHHARP